MGQPPLIFNGIEGQFYNNTQYLKRDKIKYYNQLDITSDLKDIGRVSILSVRAIT